MRGVHNKCGGVAGKCEYLINGGRVEKKNEESQWRGVNKRGGKY